MKVTLLSYSCHSSQTSHFILNGGASQTSHVTMVIQSIQASFVCMWREVGGCGGSGDVEGV